MKKFEINKDTAKGGAFSKRTVEADWYMVDGDFLYFLQSAGVGEDPKRVLTLRAEGVQSIELIEA